MHDLEFQVFKRGPLRDDLCHIERVEIVPEQLVIQGDGGKRPNSDLESVRRRRAMMRMMLHVPQVAELMFGS